MRFYPIIGFDKEHNETNEFSGLMGDQGAAILTGTVYLTTPTAIRTTNQIVSDATSELRNKGYQYNFENATAQKAAKEAIEKYNEAVIAGTASAKMWNELVDYVCIAGQIGHYREEKVYEFDTYYSVAGSDKRNDCSSTIQELFASCGINIRSSSNRQFNEAQKNPNKWQAIDVNSDIDTLPPGGLIFTKSKSGSSGKAVDHVMFYLGNGMIYDCHGSRDGIEGRSARPISEVLENNIKVGIFDYIGEEGSATVDGLIRHLGEDFGEP